MNIIENIGTTDTIETGGQSATAAVCEQAALFGATPERDEFDSREVWDADEATGAVCEAFRIIAEGACPDGLQLADERESLLWGFVNMLDAQTQRLDRAADKLGPELRDLQREQDGTEIKSFELELLTDRARNLTDRRDAFETMRDAAPRATAPSPATPGGPGADRIPRRPASSPRRPSTPATTSAPARTARPKPICPRAPWSPSPAARTSPTRRR